MGNMLARYDVAFLRLAGPVLSGDVCDPGPWGSYRLFTPSRKVLSLKPTSALISVFFERRAPHLQRRETHRMIRAECYN